MKYLTFCLISATCFLASYTGNSDKSTRGCTADTGRLAKANDKLTDSATQSNTAIKSEQVNNQIDLTTNDRMQYSDTLFKVKAGEKINLMLTNIGKMTRNAMGHNFTLSKTGTDIIKFASEGLIYRDVGYIPPAMKDSVIAHTPLVGPGQSARILFVVVKKGYYDFICVSLAITAVCGVRS